MNTFSECIVKSLAVLLVGLGLIAFGWWLIQRDAPPSWAGPPTCDEEVMSPGDECVVWMGPGEDYTYEEAMVMREQSRQAWRREQAQRRAGDPPTDVWAGRGAIVLGGAICLGSGVWFEDVPSSVELRRRPAEHQAALTV